MKFQLVYSSLVVILSVSCILHFNLSTAYAEPEIEEGFWNKAVKTVVSAVSSAIGSKAEEKIEVEGFWKKAAKVLGVEVYLTSNDKADVTEEEGFWQKTTKTLKDAVSFTSTAKVKNKADTFEDEGFWKKASKTFGKVVFGTPKVVKGINIMWAGHITNRIARFLRNSLAVEIGYRPGTKLSTLLCNTKEKIPIKKAGIYRINCLCSAVYIGESERDIETRIKEHEADIKNKRIKTSPVAAHMYAQDNIGHSLDPTSHTLLEREHRKFFRKFKEHLHIISEPNKMNTSKGMKVSPFWSTALLPLY